jgi:hypothetical protein
MTEMTAGDLAEALRATSALVAAILSRLPDGTVLDCETVDAMAEAAAQVALSRASAQAEATSFDSSTTLTTWGTLSNVPGLAADGAVAVDVYRAAISSGRRPFYDDSEDGSATLTALKCIVDRRRQEDRPFDGGWYVIPMRSSDPRKSGRLYWILVNKGEVQEGESHLDLPDAEVIPGEKFNVRVMVAA